VTSNDIDTAPPSAVVPPAPTPSLSAFRTTVSIYPACVDCDDEWLPDNDDYVLGYFSDFGAAHTWTLAQVAAGLVILIPETNALLCVSCVHRRECAALGHDWEDLGPCYCHGAVSDHPATVPCDLPSTDFGPNHLGTVACRRCQNHGKRCSWERRMCQRCDHTDVYQPAALGPVHAAGRPGYHALTDPRGTP
jgi:hypothetical protein